MAGNTVFDISEFGLRIQGTKWGGRHPYTELEFCYELDLDNVESADTIEIGFEMTLYTTELLARNLMSRRYPHHKYVGKIPVYARPGYPKSVGESIKGYISFNTNKSGVILNITPCFSGKRDIWPFITYPAIFISGKSLPFPALKISRRFAFDFAKSLRLIKKAKVDEDPHPHCPGPDDVDY